MARKLRIDAPLFAATLLLLTISLAWVYSASVLQAELKFGDPSHFLVRQTLWVVLGISCLMITMRLDYRIYRHPTLLYGAIGLTTVALVAVYFCPPINGQHRWLGIGGLGVQPSEFAKIVAIVFVASTLQQHLEEHYPLRAALLRVGTVAGVFAALIFPEKDAGSALTLAAIAAVMTFVAGLAYKWALGALFVAPWLVYALITLEPYRQRRLAAYWDPWAFRANEGFQVVQSLIAVGSGGVWGKGFMQGVQKMFYLPEAHNDFIYAVIAEEMGLVGTTLVLICFGVIAWRGLRAARRAPDAYGALLATGITVLLVAQALVNISVVVGLVPAKGIALPFVSAGGSSMAVSLAAMGILLNISQHASATT